MENYLELTETLKNIECDLNDFSRITDTVIKSKVDYSVKGQLLDHIQRQLETLDNDQIFYMPFFVFEGEPDKGQTLAAELLGKLYETIGIIDDNKLMETLSDKYDFFTDIMSMETTEIIDILDDMGGGVIYINTKNTSGEYMDTVAYMTEELIQAVSMGDFNYMVILSGTSDMIVNLFDKYPLFFQLFTDSFQFPGCTSDVEVRKSEYSETSTIESIKKAIKNMDNELPEDILEELRNIGIDVDAIRLADKEFEDDGIIDLDSDDSFEDPDLRHKMHELNEKSIERLKKKAKERESSQRRRNKENLEEDPDDDFDEIEPIEPMDPRDIYAYLDDYVVGQEEAKKKLSIAVCNHIKRLNDSTGKISKNNVLMIGPSGCGKTLLAETVAKTLDVPFAIIDASGYTGSGWRGNDVKDMLIKLYTASGKNKRMTERGIIFIDEIDKIRSMEMGSSEGHGILVQQELLKMVEGDSVDINIHGKDVTIDTKNILFICSGAFSSLTSGEEENNAIGFITDETEHETKKITREDLIEYGIIPEFLGRVPVVIQLDALTDEQLVEVLIRPKNSITEEYKEIFKADGINLEFSDESLYEIVNRMKDMGLGTRGLRSVLEDILMDSMFNIADMEGDYIVNGNLQIEKKPMEMVI